LRRGFYIAQPEAAADATTRLLSDIGGALVTDASDVRDGVATPLVVTGFRRPYPRRT